MTAASERVRDCWDRACNLAGFKGAGSVDPRSIGAQIDATAEVLSGPELYAVRALLTEAWRLCSQEGRAEDAAECMRLAAAMVDQSGRVLGALKAVRAVEEALWADGDPSVPKLFWSTKREEIVEALRSNGFGPAVRS